MIRANQLIYSNATNAPYISSDSIAKQTDYLVFGKNGNDQLNIRRLLNSRSIYVRSDLLEKFLELTCDLNLPAQVLVTGNSDRNFTSPIELPAKFKIWYCQNNAIQNDSRIRTLPLGIENIRLGRLGLTRYYRRFDEKAAANKVCVPPMSPTNPSRFDAKSYAQQFPELFDVFSNYLSEADYFRLARSYKFMLCCEGNGFENHRIWESLYLGTFPILIRTAWSTSLEYLNLPILFVDSLEDINLELLGRHARTYHLYTPNQFPQLWTPYWRELFSLG